MAWVQHPATAIRVQNRYFGRPAGLASRTVSFQGVGSCRVKEWSFATRIRVRSDQPPAELFTVERLESVASVQVDDQTLEGRLELDLT